ncbi:MAG: flagellin [Bacteriovoracia bacterium]
MGFRIATNTGSMASRRFLRKQNEEQAQTTEKMATGSRINKAADDAAGLSISEKMKSRIRGMGQAKRNVSDGISFLQTAEGSLNQISNILVRLKELSVQSATDTLSKGERQMTDAEYQSLKNEIHRVAQSTEFNGAKLLNGRGGVYEFQIGMDNDSRVDRVKYDSSKNNATLDSLGISSSSVGNKESSQMSLTRIESAIEKISAQRARLGSLQVRMGAANNNLSYYDENLKSSKSQIRDTDYAQTTADNVKLNITTKAGVSVLAQSNIAPSAALQLLN